MRLFLEGLLRETAEISRARFGTHLDIDTKRHATDYVTDVDKEINDLCIARIKEHYPEDAIISEEDEAVEGTSGRSWYIDPIDGTQNFVMGIPLFANMVGCAENGEMMASGIMLPMQDVMYIAEKGKGATKNNKPIHASTREDLERSAGFISVGWSTKNRLELIDAIEDFAKGTPLRVSCLGSAGVTEVWAADGTHDWIADIDCAPWDYAPGALILQEAGCTVTTLDGTPWKPGDTELIAANPVLHKKLLAVLHED